VKAAPRVFVLIFFLIVPFMGSHEARAAVAVGAGFSSTTSGRQIPALAGAVGLGAWTLSGFTTGVTTPIYSHSGYLLHATTPFIKGDFLGTLEFSIGGGAYYAHRALRATPASATERNDSFSLGPSFRTMWRPGGPFYIGFDVLMGIRPSSAMLNLVYQDAAAMTVGFEL
jgi:hypothetical protein